MWLPEKQCGFRRDNVASRDKTSESKLTSRSSPDAFRASIRTKMMREIHGPVRIVQNTSKNMKSKLQVCFKFFSKQIDKIYVDVKLKMTPSCGSRRWAFLKTGRGGKLRPGGFFHSMPLIGWGHAWVIKGTLVSSTIFCNFSVIRVS